MTRWMTAVGVLAICVAVAPSLGAQWPSYPTPDVPRKDGKPVLDGGKPTEARPGKALRRGGTADCRLPITDFKI